ncbi:MAG: polysaccharide deacetylase family protein [Aurantibacter sp.]
MAKKTIDKSQSSLFKRESINLLAMALLAILTAINFFFAVPWWAYLLILFCWFLITLFGSFFIQWNYHLTSLHSNKNIAKEHVSLTFDDGPDPEYTPKVLELLKQYNARVTFFLIGEKAEKHPEIVQNILRQGHVIGNHTYSHSNNFGFFGTSKVVSELRDANSVIEKISGFKMKLYRPAFGVTNPNIQKALLQTNHDSIGWSVRSFDTTNKTSENILKRITSRISNGDIVLLHDTSPKTVDVLERLLLFLQVNNLRSVTVDELLNIKAYE